MNYSRQPVNRLRTMTSRHQILVYLSLLELQVDNVVNISEKMSDLCERTRFSKEVICDTIKMLVWDGHLEPVEISKTKKGSYHVTNSMLSMVRITKET
jgi:hypothetical protein